LKQVTGRPGPAASSRISKEVFVLINFLALFLHKRKKQAETYIISQYLNIISQKAKIRRRPIYSYEPETSDKTVPLSQGLSDVAGHVEGPAFMTGASRRPAKL
jgi:hypothetical protein